jgi:hypothetical protein
MTRSSAGRVLRRVSHPGTCEKPLVTHRRSGERLFDEPSRLKGNPQRRSGARLGLAIGEAFAAELDAESERHSTRRQRKCDLEAGARRSLVIGPMSGSLRTTPRPLTIAEAAVFTAARRTPRHRLDRCARRPQHAGVVGQRLFPGMSLAVVTGHCYREGWASLGGGPPVPEKLVVVAGVRSLSPPAEARRLQHSAIHAIPWKQGRPQGDIVGVLGAAGWPGRRGLPAHRQRRVRSTDRARHRGRAGTRRALPCPNWRT